MQKLIDALLGQRKTKAYQIGDSTVMLQTLTAGEQAEIARSISGYDLAAQSEAAKVPILARSIVSVNKSPLESHPEVREMLRADPTMQTVRAVEKTIYDLDWGLVDYLFNNCYSDLVTERMKELDSLKNSSRVQQAESFGKSAPSSAKVPVA